MIIVEQGKIVEVCAEPVNLLTTLPQSNVIKLRETGLHRDV
jgi:hypothetical protein